MDVRSSAGRVPAKKREQLHTELTEKIIGCALKVHNTLGPGFDKDIYHNALIVEMGAQQLNVENNYEIKVYYEAVNVGMYTLDFLVQDKVIVKVMAVEDREGKYVHQVKAHLAAAGLQVGLILNFGGTALDIKRVEPRIFKQNGNTKGF